MWSDCHGNRGHRHREWEPFPFSELFGGRRRRGPWGGSRMFDQGDLKYVILQLLAEKPRHGYEIIKALEEKSGGAYAPSAGAVYPTLTLLEDLGYAALSTDAADGPAKKVYVITDAGRAYLADNRAQADDVFERIADLGASFLSDGMRDVGRAFAKVARVTFTTSSSYMKDSEHAKHVRDVLERAAEEIERIVSSRSGKP